MLVISDPSGMALGGNRHNMRGGIFLKGGGYERSRAALTAVELPDALCSVFKATCRV